MNVQTWDEQVKNRKAAVAAQPSEPTPATTLKPDAAKIQAGEMLELLRKIECNTRKSSYRLADMRTILLVWGLLALFAAFVSIMNSLPH